ncbi:MAG: phytoene desaturase family protein [Congregibacter sp.]
MRWIFDALFAAADAKLEDHLELFQADVLARHAWRQGGLLDLYANTERSAQAIREFAGEENADAYLDFCARSADIYATLREPYIASPRPGMFELVQRVGFTRLDAMWRTAPFTSLWRALGQHFSDPRLQQLFARYATYVGSSPLQAPATLMLIAHVEQDGVWLVKGGMRAVALALQEIAEGLGATFCFDDGAQELLVEAGRVIGARTQSGREFRAESVVFNGDISVLGTGLLGREVSSAVTAVRPAQRALSAITYCVYGRVSGLDLHYHNVFFADDYPEEFRAIFGRGEITEYPTVYVCAQDRVGDARPEGAERLLLLINAPADGDRVTRESEVLDAYFSGVIRLLAECGCKLDVDDQSVVPTAPAGFNTRFPGSGGSLYGRVNHGPMASFSRPGARSRVPGLYLAGGSVHPGAGVPMSAMSGRLAAAAVIEDA